MLPLKIGEGVFGSNSGGVKPTGASVASSVTAAVLMLLEIVSLKRFGLVKDNVGDCFHGTETCSLGLALEKGGVKRVV